MATDKPKRKIVHVMGYYALEDGKDDVQMVKEWFEKRHYGLNTQIRGGGAMVSLGHLVIDSHGHGVGDDEMGISYGFGRGSVQVGRIMLQNRYIRLYPLIGIGGAGLSVENSPDVEGVTAWGSMIGTVGLGVDVRLKVWRFGMVIGVRAGYYRTLLVSPDAQQEGVLPASRPFVRLIIGLGV